MQRELEIIPKVGVGSIHLGDSEEEVRQAMTHFGVTVDDSIEPWCWEYPWGTLSFVKEPTKKLAQIFCESDESLIYGRPIVGLRLDDALQELGVQSFEDTVWVMTSPDTDFPGGVPRVDDDYRANISSAELLNRGTLWVKSLGLGLELFRAEVNSVSIRLPQFVPKIGCGPLQEQTLIDIDDPDITSSPSVSTRIKPNRIQSAPWVRLLLWVATGLTVAVLGWVIYSMVNDYRAWLNATPVMGRVISLTPEGPFPDELVVEFSMPNKQMGKAIVPSQYTTAREVGQEVELVYRESDPSFAMTRLQSRDNFSSLSFNWIIYLVPLFGLEIYMLFPNFNRRRSY